MYGEEGELTKPEEICDAILTKNLFGIDIDARAVQIAEVALWMKAAERAFDYRGVPTNLVAATASHLKGEAWEEFLSSFQREPSVARVLRKFAQTMEHIDEIGSLARPAEDLREIIREEHATWERQVRERREANFLFPEMRDEALSGRLPFHEISDEEFGERLFYRAKAGVDAFTEGARASGQFEDQLLGSEAHAGFRLMELLSRRYDVVAANPPFMGKGNMSSTLNAYCQSQFANSFYDTCMVFIERVRGLIHQSGVAGVVTQQTLLNLPAYDELRRDLLDSAPLHLIVQLGTGAFEAISGAKVNPILMVYGCGNVGSSTTVFIRLVNSDAKARDLRLACQSSMNPDVVFHRAQKEFLQLPRFMVLFTLPDDVLKTLRGGKLGDCGRTYSGLLSGDNERLLRQQWETPVGSPECRFRPYAKGGPFCRWFGNLDQSVRWDATAHAFFSECSATRLAGLTRYFEEGMTWSDLAGIGLSARHMPPGFIFDQTSPAFFVDCDEDLFAYLAYLNSSFCRYLAQSFNPTLHIKCGDIESMPRIAAPEVLRTLCFLGRMCLALSRQVAAQDPREWAFQSSFAFRDFKYETRCLAMLHTLESLIDHLVFTYFRISREEVTRFYGEIGRPSGTSRCERAEEKFLEMAASHSELEAEDVTAVIELFGAFRLPRVVRSLRMPYWTSGIMV